MPPAASDIDDSSSQSSIVVSYHTSPSADVWERIQADLHRQLPLKNLSWKPANRPLRVIPSLPVSFQPFSSISPSLSSSPLAHVLFVACDDHEAYKTIIKQEIRTWLDSVQSDQSEWLIVHVSTASRLNNSSAGIFRTKAGVLDKLKADFNPQKKDRCIQLSYMSTMDAIVQASIHDSSSQWSELISRLKESLLIGLALKITEMEESLRSLISKRSRHGWDFETFFIQKAQLANQFEVMNLLEDSLIQYDELDATFSQSLSDCPQIWHNKVFGKSSSQYSTLALDTDYSEQYLELVGSGQMSIFDLRIYLFSKQVNLLARLDRLDEAIGRATTFMSTFSAFLRTHQHIWPPNFIESWVYSTCNELVEWCESRIESINKDVSSFESLRRCAQLLELAHNQLDRIGIEAGHLPSKHPFNMSLSPVQECSSRHSSPKLSSPPVPPQSNTADSFKDPKAFDKVYIDLARRAINLYQTTGRRRFALKLHCKTAAFEETRNRYESAHRLYSHLPAHYVDNRWTAIESSLLDQCTRLQEQLGLSKEWLLSTLALVRSGAVYQPGKWSQDVLIKPSSSSSPTRESDDPINHQADLASRLMRNIQEQSMKLEKDFAAISFPTFSIALNSPIGCHLSLSSPNLEGSVVKARVTNLLPCPIDVEAVRMKFSGRKYETLWFTAGASKLLSGETKLDLMCPTSVAETLVLEVSQIRISRILFQYYHRPQGPKNDKVDDRKPLEIVSFPSVPLGLDVKIELPRDICLDQPTRCIVCLSSGLNELSQAVISISPESDLTFDFSNSLLCEPLGCQAQLIGESSDKITLKRIPANSHVYIALPFHTTVDQSSVDVNIDVIYCLSQEENVNRHLKKSSRLFISPPLNVRIREIFRPNWVFTNFTIGTDNVNPIRIAGTRLETVDGLSLSTDSEISISPACDTNQRSLVILPTQSTDFIFKIASDLKSTDNLFHLTSKSRFRLVVKYRLVIDEIIDCLKERLETGSAQESKGIIPFLLEQAKGLIIQSGFHEEFYSGYLDDQSLRSDLLMDLDWNLICNQVEMDLIKKDLLVRWILSSIQDSSLISHESQTSWRSISLEFELGKNLLLASIDYRLEDPKIIGTVGKSIRIEIVISILFKSFKDQHPSFQRPSSTSVDHQPVLIYDFNSSLDWLIGGRKRGRFIARVEEEEKIELILIPLRSGYLRIPRLRIEVAKEGLDSRDENFKELIISDIDPIPNHHSIESSSEQNPPALLTHQHHLSTPTNFKLQLNHLNLFQSILVIPSPLPSSSSNPS